MLCTYRITITQFVLFFYSTLYSLTMFMIYTLPLAHTSSLHFTSSHLIARDNPYLLFQKYPSTSDVLNNTHLDWKRFNIRVHLFEIIFNPNAIIPPL